MKTENGLLFREMQPDDREQMISFYASLGEKSASFFNVDRGNEKRTMDFFSGGRPGHRYYVAVTDGVIAGHLFIWDTYTGVPWLGIAVRDDYQGRHIGTFMMRSVETLLRAEGYGGLILRTSRQNFAAQRLYEACAYERIGIHPSGEYLYLRRFPKEETP